MMTRDVIIIGGGPAGVACAIQLKRQGKSPLILEKERIGGLLWNASLIENYPGFPSGIKAVDFIGRLEQHLEKLKVETRFEEAISVEYQKGRNFSVATRQTVYTSEYLVVASGTAPSMVCEIPGELSGSVYYDIRALSGVHGKNIGIIGAGDAAFDYALNLAGKGNHVGIFNRTSKIKGLPLLVSRAGRSKQIEYLENHILKAIKKPEEGSGVKLFFNVDNFDKEYRIDYLIFATGRKPALDFLGPGFKDRLDKLVSSGKLHLIGDVNGGRYRQASIAAGEGVRAAMVISDEGNKENRK